MKELDKPTWSPFILGAYCLDTREEGGFAISEVRSWRYKPGRTVVLDVTFKGAPYRGVPCVIVHLKNGERWQLNCNLEFFIKKLEEAKKSCNQ